MGRGETDGVYPLAFRFREKERDESPFSNIVSLLNNVQIVRFVSVLDRVSITVAMFEI